MGGGAAHKPQSKRRLRVCEGSVPPPSPVQRVPAPPRRRGGGEGPVALGADTSAPACFPLPPPQLTHPGPRGAEPGGVGWGHRARLRAPPTQVGAPAPAPPHPPPPGTADPSSGTGGQRLRTPKCSVYARGGVGCYPKCYPPRKIPPSPARVSTPAQVVSSPGTQTRPWEGGSQSDVPPSSPAASSRVPWPDAVIPPRLPHPPARGVGAGVPAALQGGREGGGAQRRALQGHLLQELVEVRAGRQVHAGRHPGKRGRGG